MDNATLLIIHTDYAATQALTQVLGEHGYTLQVVEPSGGRFPYFTDNIVDLVLIGIPLLDANSYELCHAFKQGRTTRDLPVVMVGDRLPDQIAKAFDVGASDYLSLPLHPQEIIARIQYQLKGYRRRQ
ncbi:MAG: response regulator, partial [Cyanobacteria bacterium P01_F01_bin.86]